MNHELAPPKRSDWLETEAHIFAVAYMKKKDWKPEHFAVTYSYTVHGELYLGDYRDYAKTCTLARGDKLTVLYNPRNPKQSRLPRHNSFGWRQILSIAVGILALLFKFAHGLIFPFVHRIFR